MKLTINPNLEIPDVIGRVFIKDIDKDTYRHVSSFTTINKDNFPNSVEIERGRVDICSLMGITPTSLPDEMYGIKRSIISFPGILQLPEGKYRVEIASPDYNWGTETWGTMTLKIERKICILESLLISLIRLSRTSNERLNLYSQRVKNYSQRVKNYIASV